MKSLDNNIIAKNTYNVSQNKFRRNFVSTCKRLIPTLVLVTLSIAGCKKFVDVAPPSTSLTNQAVFQSDATAIAAVTYLFSQLSGYPTNGTSVCSLSFLAGMSADELTLWSGGNAMQNAYYTNALVAPITANATTYGSELWTTIYPSIYTCNVAIEGLNASTTLTPSIKQQLLGEAKFTRAFYYFYLVNLFGDVPLALSSDFNVNRLLSRAPASQVYQQIISDLKDAQTLLNSNYLSGTLLATTTERVRPTSSVASALLARVYLYYGNLTGDASNYSYAEAQASLVIQNSSYSLTPLNSVFLRNSNEAIWQLQTVSNGTNSLVTFESAFFNISFVPTAGINSTHPVYLSTTLLNSFETGDQRKVNGNWVNVYTDPTGTYYYPFKYKATTTVAGSPPEYRMMLRLGEQYLIRAEARAEQNNVGGAQADLNAIRSRAGLAPTTAATQASLLTAIMHERQVELFTELGSRWFDLKRTGTIDAVMSVQTPLKGGTWNSYQKLYPVSTIDLTYNVNMKQNPGY